LKDKKMNTAIAEFKERKAPVSNINPSDWLDYSVTESLGDLLDGEPRDIATAIDENIDMDVLWATQKAALVAFYYSTHAYSPKDREMFAQSYAVFAKSHFQAMLDTLEKVAKS
jgi:hypothetical protein